MTMKKKIQTTTTEEKSSTPSKPKRAYDKKKTSHHIQRKEKFLGHDRVMLYKTRSSDNFERTSPNSGYVSQTAHALFKTIYKGFTFGLTNQFCLYYDLMFTNLINYQTVLKLVKIFLSLRVLTRNSEILALR